MCDYDKEILDLAEKALRLAAKASLGPWKVNDWIDAGYGIGITVAETDTAPSIDHIRVCTPTCVSVAGGTRTITPAQRDADAEFIAQARTLLPELAAAVAGYQASAFVASRKKEK